MTTIAYRDGIMAADDMVVWGGDVSYGENKLAKTPKYLLGFTGAMVCKTPMYDWISEMDEKDVEPLKFYKYIEKLHSMENICTALMVEKKLIWYVTSDGKVGSLTRSYEVMGSGSRFAMGAMYRGATAVQAIETAIELDDGTGGIVNTVTFDCSEKSPGRA